MFWSQGCKHCRVLFINGSTCGLHAVQALRNGATHVTSCEPFLYNAKAARNVVEANGYKNGYYASIVHGHPSELQEDYKRTRYHLIVLNMHSGCLLSNGAILEFQHALKTFAADDTVVLPSSMRMFVQGASMRTGERNGFDMTSMDSFRCVGNLDELSLSAER